MKPRPKAVTVVAVFLFFATIIAVVVGASLLFPNPLLDWLWELNRPAEAVFRSFGRIAGVALILLGLATFAAARGLLRRDLWAWWFAIILFTVNGIGDLVSFVATGDWLRSASGVVISSVFIGPCAINGSDDTSSHSRAPKFRGTPAYAPFSLTTAACCGGWTQGRRKV